jgi:hypothetical protein
MTMMRAVRVAAAVLSLAMATSIPPAVAGPFDKELGSDPAKLAGDAKISMMNGDSKGLESGKGLVPYLKALGGPPRRVALVSFDVWDHGNKKEKSYNFYGGNYTYRVDTTRSQSVNAQAMDMLATELHDASIAGLKAQFAAVGMQLLEPAEYLDTPEKKAAYETVKIEEGGMGKLFGMLQSKDAAEWQWGVPPGYRLIKLPTVGDARGNNFALSTTGIGVGKLADSLGYDLAKGIGVDAVVVLYNVVQADKSAIRLRGAYMYMFGPNPVPDTGQGSYWKGQQYSGVYLRTDVDFIETDKDGNLVSADYAGYGVVGQALAMRMAQHVKQKSE